MCVCVCVYVFVSNPNFVFFYKPSHPYRKHISTTRSNPNLMPTPRRRIASLSNSNKNNHSSKLVYPSIHPFKIHTVAVISVVVKTEVEGGLLVAPPENVGVGSGSG